MRCTACGTELHDPQQFCTKCGARLTAKSDTPKPLQANPIYIAGQKKAVSRLDAIIQFCRNAGVAAEHILLVGQDGMGKRAIARVFARRLGVEAKELDATTIERPIDFTLVVNSLEPSQVLLVQNIGSLRPNLRQLVLTALQHYRIDLVIGKGLGARTHAVQLNRFTCIATASRESDCPPELRDAFALTITLEPYSQPELEALATLISLKAGVTIDPGAAKLIAGTCGGVPHQLEITIQRLAKLSPGTITEKNTVEILSTYGVRVSTSRPSEPSGDLQNLTGIQFEELITSLLARLGFHAQMTKASGDGDIDIVAVLDKPLVGGKYLIQCKRFSLNTMVSAPVVREFYGAVSAERKAVKGILITTSRFTEQARDFAHEVGIELIDMEQLNRLLTEHGMGGRLRRVSNPSSKLAITHLRTAQFA